MTADERQKALSFLLVLLVGVVLAAVVVPRLLASADGPEGELIAQLKQLERQGFTHALSGGEKLRGVQVHYQRLQVQVAPDGQTASVRCTLDFVGDLDGRTTVSSLGLEQVDFVLKDGDWVLADGPAPRLGRIVRALEGRRAKLESGQVPLEADGGPPALAEVLRIRHRRWKSLAWYIRSERQTVDVSEDARLEGDLPERPVDDLRTIRLRLTEDASGVFLFAGGLM